MKDTTCDGPPSTLPVIFGSHISIDRLVEVLQKTKADGVASSGNLYVMGHDGKASRMVTLSMCQGDLLLLVEGAL